MDIFFLFLPFIQTTDSLLSAVESYSWPQNMEGNPEVHGGAKTQCRKSLVQLFMLHSAIWGETFTKGSLFDL